jgi:caffeoyl-CoA O-methyltransferase
MYYQPAADVILNIQGPIDFAFIDADKENYPTYLDLLVPVMRRGGLIVTDNVLWSGKVVEDDAQDTETIAIRAFNQKVVDHPELEHVLIPLRDGLLLARKK